MALQAIRNSVNGRDDEDAAVELIYVPGFTPCREGNWQPSWDPKRLEDQLTWSFPEARVHIYDYLPHIAQSSDLNAVESERIRNAAVLLLSECQRIEPDRRSCHSHISSDLSTLHIGREPRSIVFVCQGLGGLVVKEALILAENSEEMTSTARRTCGIIFVGTPHAGNVESWAHKFQKDCDRLSISDGSMYSEREYREPSEMLKPFAEISSAFDKISLLYTNVHFCQESWLECSDASLLHGDCLWATISQSHVLDSVAQHYLMPQSLSQMAFETGVKGAVGCVIRAAIRRDNSYHTSLKYQKALKARYTEERLPNTCTWLLRHGQYKQWLNADGPTCLWIHGVAGTGKSVLSSAIFDDLLRRERSKNVIISCFLDESFAWNDTAQFILQTLISQLELHDRIKIMTPRVRSILTDIETSILPIPTTIFQHHLRIIFADVQTDARIFLVFDGLDSDGWMKDLITRQVVEANAARRKPDFLRCSFSSRTPYDGTCFQNHVTEIKLSREAGIQRDLMSFAKHRLSTLRPSGCKGVSSLAPAQRLCSRAEGVFLWMTLATEDLCRSQPLPDIFTNVNLLPLGLNGLYRKALEGIPHRNVDVAIKVFSWLLASRRPLKLSELVEALRIESGTTHSPTESILDLQHPDRDIPSLCGSLVSITNDNIVKFAHPSIRGYLLSTHAQTQPWHSVRHAHELLAKTCLTVLDSGHVEQQYLLGIFSQRVPGGFDDSTPALVNYAVESWASHYGLAEPFSKLLPATLQRILSKKLNYAYEKLWLGPHGRSTKIMQTVLRICSLYGFRAMVQMYLEMGVSPDCESCTYCAPPIYLAAAGGHSETVALLLRKGADVNTRNYSNGGTPLCPVAATRTVDKTEDLQHGALTSACWSNSGMTLIHVTASLGHLEVTKLLISSGADVNAVLKTSNETPLHLASARGHFHVVKHLVDEWDISAKAINIYDKIVQQSYYQTWSDDIFGDRWKNGAFIWEYDARCSAEQDMEKLLTCSMKYADINARDCHGRTPLHQAAQNGHEAVTRLLIEVGASHEAQDNYGFTALQLAVKNGHLAIVRLLVMAGVRINIGAKCWGPALEQAAENGHDPLANLIIWQTFREEISGSRSRWPELLLPLKGKQNVIQSVLGRRRDQSGKTGRGTSTRLSVRSRNS